MATAVHYSRTQWASGQGFFHSGSVAIGDRRVNYVYDCGSLEPGALKREVEEFQNRCGRVLDLLFLSHFHLDHVSGLEQLFASLSVQSVIIPVTTSIERLYVLGGALSMHREVPGWYLSLIADPISLLGEMSNGAQVISVSPEEDGGDHPDDDVDDDAPDSMPLESFDQLPTGTMDEDYSRVIRLKPGKRSVLSGSSIEGNKDTPIWEWHSMLVRLAKSREGKFLKSLADKLSMSPAALQARLRTETAIRELVRDQANAITAAYRCAYPDMNLSSLLVYSGPCFEMPYQGRTYRRRSVIDRGEVNAWDVKPGWLGTGDQRMGRRRIHEVARYFGASLSRVGTLALPHHGSHDSFDPALLGMFDEPGPVCSVSVGSDNTYGHPDRRVIIDVSAKGNHFVAVTEHEASRWTESGVTYL